MSEETLGEALRRWRDERRLSLRALDKRANYSHVYLWEIEKDLKAPGADLVAKLDEVLGAGGQLIAKAARSRGDTLAHPAVELGLRFGSDWSGSMETVTALWRHDAGRRKLIRGMVFVSAAMAAPVKGWLDAVDTEAAPPAQMEHPAAASVREMTKMFRRLDNQYGGGQIRAAAAQYLDAEVAHVLRAGNPLSLGAAYLSAVTELTQLAGWLAYDACDHGIAQRYFIQALDLARWAIDRTLGAEILAGMSHQATFLRSPKRAVTLAGAAQRTAERAGVPALVAEALLMEAHAHAVAGAEKECTAALTAAESVLAQGSRDSEPYWIKYLDEAYLAAISGHCFRALGHAEAARRAAERSLDMRPGYARGQVFNQLLLARAHVLDRNIDQACDVAHQALDLAEGMSSARAVTYVDRLVRELQPWRSDRRVKAVADRASLVTV